MTNFTPLRRKNPPHVHSFSDRYGVLRHYVRIPGKPSVALEGIPWSPSYMQQYAAALNGAATKLEIGLKRTKAGTINAVLVAYYQSADFSELRESTRKSRRAILERFREQHGDKGIRTFHQKALITILSSRPRYAARNWLKALRGLISFAVKLGFRDDNVCQGIKLPTLRSSGFHTWTDDEIEQFMRIHPQGTRARLALALLLYTGQRRGDVVLMGRQHIRANTLSLKQQKTGNQIDIPVIPELEEAIAQCPSQSLTFLLTDYGKPFTAAGFGAWFREQCDAAGLKHCSSHGLRKSAATRLAEAGASTSELMAWFGWRSMSEAERYTRAVNRKQLAVTASEKLRSRTEICKPRTGFAR